MTVAGTPAIADHGHATPSADVAIDVALLCDLLRHQHPDLADLPLTLAASGWDNMMIRIGDDLCARLPRRAIAASLLRTEQAWLRRIAPHVPVSVPVPVRLGAPSADYPYPWSIIAWLPGQPVDTATLAADQAEPLADFLIALHRIDAHDGPSSDVRGMPLAARAAIHRARIDRLAPRYPALMAAAVDVWDAALAVPVDTAPVLLHADLHPRNVLMQGGVLSAVIDWGDLCVGDPCYDLAAAWFLLPDATARDRMFVRYGASDATQVRARGWAVAIGLILLETGLVDHPIHAAIGQRILTDACDMNPLAM
jgi:aminoglycoside phosphotransferase (APT) family kinase protein